MHMPHLLVEVLEVFAPFVVEGFGFGSEVLVVSSDFVFLLALQNQSFPLDFLRG